MSSRRKKRRQQRQQRHNKKKITFSVDQYICIRKQTEGVGKIHKDNGSKGSYLIAFKNGRFGWYRYNKIKLITEDEYNDANSDFVINKNLPSPSPTPSLFPSPSPMNKNNDNELEINNNNQ
eukprot:404614_1